METTDHAGRLSAEVDALMQPLHRHYEELTREIDEAETKARELRVVRTKVRAMIRLADPAFAMKPRANGKTSTSGSSHAVTEAALLELADWLVANAAELNALHDGEGFYASGLVRDYQDRLPKTRVRNQSPMSNALRKLHERGVVQLASKGKGSGGRYYYKVIA